MPIRRKIKKALKLSDSRSSSPNQHETIAGRKGSCYYQPGEPIPVAKHRGEVDPKHKAKLENFTFETSDWRRKSSNSLYSPMGSKMPSRNGSIHTRQKPHNPVNSHFGEVPEDLDAPDDVTNVGGTRNHSFDAGKETHEHHEYAADLHRSETAQDHAPFTEADLSQALERLSTRTAVTD